MFRYFHEEWETFDGQVTVSAARAPGVRLRLPFPRRQSAHRYNLFRPAGAFVAVQRQPPLR